MKIRFSMLLLSSLLMFFTVCITGLCAQELVSANPRYMRIVLPELGDKGVKVILDESGGTGKGFDTIMADMNLDGAINPGEKFTSTTSASTNGAFYPLPLVTLKPIGKNAVKYEFLYMCALVNNVEYFNITVARNIRYKKKVWRATYSGNIAPSKDASAPLLYKPIVPPKAILIAEPNERTMGIALVMISHGITITSSDVMVKLQIKNGSGKVVKQDKGSLDKYAYGGNGIFSYSVGLPAGRYTIVAFLNTGPLAGVIKVSKPIIVAKT